MSSLTFLFVAKPSDSRTVLKLSVKWRRIGIVPALPAASISYCMAPLPGAVWQSLPHGVSDQFKLQGLRRDPSRLFTALYMCSSRGTNTPAVTDRLREYRTLLVFGAIFTFLVDSYPLYAASALAANSFVRSSFAGKRTSSLLPRPCHVLRLIFLDSRLPPFRDPDVREAGLPMGVECLGVPDGGYDAVPIHLLQVREAHQGEESVCVRLRT